MKRSRIAPVLSSAAIAAALVTVTGGPAAAVIKPRSPVTLYVAPAMRSGLPPACQTAAYTDINAAITAATPGDRVVVCPGTYAGSATVTTSETVQPTFTTGVFVDKSIDLVGMTGAVVNATGLDTGVTVWGVAGATVRGLAVNGAFGEGILVTSSSRATVEDNQVTGDDLGTATTAYFECHGASPGALGDCGYGIHLISSVHSQVLDNTVEFNSGGILVSDEFGPAHADTIKGNTVEDNETQAGIKLTGRSALGVNSSGVPTPRLGGVYDNTVSDNIVVSNGTVGKAGGIVMNVAGKGGASYSNLVDGNEVVGNGHSGIIVRRNHWPSDAGGDLIYGNWIGTNNLSGEAADPQTTGILVERASTSIPAISVTVFDNTIAFDHYGIFDNGGPGFTHFGNHFLHVVVDIAY